MLVKIFDVLVDELEDYSIPNTTPTVKPKIKEINGFGKKVGERANIDLNDAKTSFFLIMNAMLLPGSWLQLILSRDKKEPCLLFFYFLDEQYFDALDPVSVRKITERFTSWRWQPDHHLGQATQIWQALLDEHCKASKLTFSSAEKWEAWQIMLDLGKMPNSELEDTVELLENRRRLEHKNNMNEVIFSRFRLLVQRKVERLRAQGRLPQVDPNAQHHAPTAYRSYTAPQEDYVRSQATYAMPPPAYQSHPYMGSVALVGFAPPPYVHPPPAYQPPGGSAPAPAPTPAPAPAAKTSKPRSDKPRPKPANSKPAGVSWDDWSAMDSDQRDTAAGGCRRMVDKNGTKVRCMSTTHSSRTHDSVLGITPTARLAMGDELAGVDVEGYLAYLDTAKRQYDVRGGGGAIT